ncbi:MAG: class I SAM-dependent methyltransferase [Gemmatimonadota bacterium]|nr:MAG: class I SAM-dependent methyltransferase [Gemmatimonadota bacterium]
MTIVDIYRSQWKWRSWSTVFDALPDVSGTTVLDLGCGIGDQAAELAARGAHVVGFDMNDDLLEAARSRRIPNAEFRRADLRALPDPGVLADGLCCSFTAAYFTDLAFVLPQWCKHLRPRAWVALTEVDDLFGHAPLSDRANNAFQGYVRQALAAGRYDFRMGRKLRDYAERAGKRIGETIEGGLRAASRRGVVYSKRGRVYPDCKRFRDYSREKLKEVLLAVMGHTWWDQGEAIRAAVRYLGFPKAGPKRRKAFRSAINGLIRQGRLERDGSKIRAIR